MELYTAETSTSLKKGQCLTEKQIMASGLTPTNIDCFQFSHFLLYAQDNKRVILQPLPHNQYRVIRVYDYIEAPATNYIN